MNHSAKSCFAIDRGCKFALLTDYIYLNKGHSVVFFIIYNKRYVRPLLVERSVVVPSCVITSMRAAVIINYFCIKKILFSKKEKRQKKVFVMIFRKKLGNL